MCVRREEMIRTHLWWGWGVGVGVGRYLWTNQGFTGNLSTAGTCHSVCFTYLFFKMYFIRGNKQMRKKLIMLIRSHQLIVNTNSIPIKLLTLVLQI